MWGYDERDGEDDWNDAGRVYFQWQVGLLAGLLAAAARDTLGILHRNFPERLLEIHDADRDGDDRECKEDQNEDVQEQLVPCILDLLRIDLVHRIRDRRNDTREDDDRDPVPHPVLGDLLTKPEKERRACCQNNRDDEVSRNAVVLDQRAAVHAVKAVRHGDRLDKCQDDREVSGELGQLPPADLALFRPLGEFRDDIHLEELDDDRCRDVRHDAHRQNGEVRERAAPERIQKADQAELIGCLKC